jgi:hypothetical protein
MSHASLLMLMERDLVEQSEVEQKVCPVMLMLTEMDRPVEFHTGAVAVRFSHQIRMIRVSTYLHLFLPQCMK